MSRPFLERLGAGAALLALLGFTWTHMAALGDTFWSLALGRLLLEGGPLPATDPFTFTAGDEPLTFTMPLTQAFFAQVERLGGLRGVLLAGALLFTASLGLLWLSVSRGPSRWLLYPLLPAIVYLARDDLAVRGQLLGDISFVVLLVGLRHLRASPDGGALSSRSVLWGAPALLGALWMNAHPSAVLGGVLLVLEVVLSVGSPALRRAVAVAVLFALGLLVTPEGPGLLVQAVDLARLPSTRSLDLFQTPDFRRPEVLFWLGLAIAALHLELRRGRERAVGAATWLCVLLVLSLSARRHLPWLAMVTLASLAEIGGGPGLSLGSRARALSGAGSLAVALLCAVAFTRTHVDPLRDAPVGGVDALEGAGLSGHVLAPYHWGGYLEHRLGPTRRVFIDGRNQLFDRSEVFRDHGRIARLEPAWPELLDAYRIQAIVWERGAPLGRALAHHPGYRLLYRGPIEVVYSRVDGAR